MAIRMHSFLGKVNIEGLHMMDDHVNEWLKRHQVTPIHIKQSFGSERHHGAEAEPILVITVWYEAKEDAF